MRIAQFCLLASASILAGCGGLGSSPASPIELGPHRGRLLKMPEGVGSAEVVVRPTSASVRSMTNAVTAYFYGPDAKTPLAPAPTDVSIQLYFAESKTLEKVALKPAEKSDGEDRQGGFTAIPPPGFDGQVRSGRLTARHEGREIDLPF